MKTSEILLASAVLSIVAGGGAALAAGTFLGVRATRADGNVAARAASAEMRAVDGSSFDVAHELDQLRLENSGLRMKLDELERRLADSLSARVPLESASPLAGSSPGATEVAMLSSGEVTPEFVQRVDAAMATIRAREEAEREVKRKELQAQRIEQRITDLQAKLGLSSRQAGDLRTILIDQDDRREKLFTSMRDSPEPRDMREAFRTIRDETYASLERVLTPEQLEGYKQSEERDWGRGPGGPGGDRGGQGGFGGFGGTGGDARPQRRGGQ